MHWAVDHGAAALARDLAAAIGTSAVLSRFTRLLIDPNRELSSPTLFRSHCDDIPVDLNRGLDDGERARRIEGFYLPYHAAISAEMQRVPRQLVFAVHSFTPEYEGRKREVQVGVLFDKHADHGHRLAGLLAGRLAFDVALNAPWSGANGLMYSAQSHADRHGAVALEIEARQDLLVEPAFRAELCAALAASLNELVA